MFLRLTFWLCFIVNQDDFSKEIKIKAVAREGFFFFFDINCYCFWLNVDKMEALKLRMFFSLLAKFSCFSEILSVLTITYREWLPSYQYRWRTSARKWASPTSLKIPCEVGRYLLNFITCIVIHSYSHWAAGGSTKPICSLMLTAGCLGHV